MISPPPALCRRSDDSGRRIASWPRRATPLSVPEYLTAVPAGAAQEVLDRLVACGVRSILSFAPTTLSHPEDVDVRHVDLATELQVLAYFGR